MTLNPIKTEEDYQNVLARLEIIFDAVRGTRDGDELEVLGMLIDEYEKEFFPVDLNK